VLVGVFRLALLLGKTVSELNMSWREFQYWQAYLQIEPPDEGDNRRTAMLLAQITNMAGRMLPDKKTVTPNDFLSGLGVTAKPKGQSMQDQIAFMKSIGKPDGG